MRTTLFYALALFVSAGCSSSKYQIVEPKPQLSLSTVATVCELGQAVSLTLAVSQEGVDGNFSLSAKGRPRSHSTGATWTHRANGCSSRPRMHAL